MQDKELDGKRRDFLKRSLAVGASGMLMGLPLSFSTFFSRPAEAAETGQYDEEALKRDLNGVLLDYTYPGGGPHYVVTISLDKVDFRSPWPGEEPEQPPPSEEPPREGAVTPPSQGVDYRARKIQDGLYLVHWIVNWEIHVALLFDFVNKKTICAALMPGKTELWDVAHWDRWKLPRSLSKYQ